MKDDIILQIRNSIQTILREGSEGVFDELLKVFSQHYGRPSHSMVELREKANKKIKGDMFEHFALLYLEHVLGITAWLLEDVPEEVLAEVQLTRRDMGIDIIGKDKLNRFYAIQVKYRSTSSYKSKIIVGWKQLSTFFALAARSGPYYQTIVFTNANGVKRVGGVKKGDKSICIGSLRKIKVRHWLSMAGITGERVSKGKVRKLSRSGLRKARLQALSPAT